MCASQNTRTSLGILLTSMISMTSFTSTKMSVNNWVVRTPAPEGCAPAKLLTRVMAVARRPDPEGWAPAMLIFRDSLLINPPDPDGCAPANERRATSLVARTPAPEGCAPVNTALRPTMVRVPNPDGWNPSMLRWVGTSSRLVTAPDPDG